jgi:hypothetical protein
MNNFYFILPTLVPMSSSGWLLWRCRRVVGRSTTTEFWVSQQLAKDPVLPTIETTIARASPFYCGATHTQTHCTTCSTSRYGIDKLCFVLFFPSLSHPLCAQQFNYSGRSEGRIRNETTNACCFFVVIEPPNLCVRVCLPRPSCKEEEVKDKPRSLSFLFLRDCVYVKRDKRKTILRRPL